MNRREQLIIVAAVMAALVAGFYLKVLSPKVHKASQLATQLTNAQNARDAAVAQAASAQGAAASYTSNLHTISTIRAAVPESDAAPSLLRQLQAAADKTQVTFDSIQLNSGSSAAPTAPGAAPPPTRVSPYSGAPGVPSPPPGYAGAALPTVSYTLKFAGGYLKLQQFLDAMYGLVGVHKGQVDAHGRLITVRSFGIGGTSGHEKIQLTVDAYILPSSLQVPIPTPNPAALSSSSVLPASNSKGGKHIVASVTASR